MSEIPTYEAVVNMEDQTGASVVSLVEQPAIEVDWFAFSGNQKSMYFERIDEQKLAGPFMIPDVPIYRNDESGEYYLKFSKDTVKTMAEKFNKELFGKNVTLEHSGQPVTAFVAENWIVEGPDKSKKYGFSLPEGTWFGVIKIEDEAFWTEFVRTGKVKGFSIEAMLGVTRQKTQMNKMNTEMTKAKLADGTEVSYEALEVGMVLSTVDATGAEVVAADGDYTLEDGTLVSVKEGLISAVTPAAPAAPVAPDSVMASAEDVVEAPVASEPAPETPEVNTEMESMVNKAVETATSMLIERLTALENAFKTSSEENQTLKEQVAGFAKMPGAKSVTLSSDKDADRKGRKMTFQEQREALRGLAGR